MLLEHRGWIHAVYVIGTEDEDMLGILVSVSILSCLPRISNTVTVAGRGPRYGRRLEPPVLQ